ncbi:MAG TPA: uracil-DNA glycosylase [Halococcus sp.]|nr:uracil-DNA glycosylase [Halococcus sp.]
MSDDAGTMEGLTVVECTRCPELCESRSQIVNGTGPDDAELLFVGEGPGAQEDSAGEPFVGRSGSVLDDALTECGLDREAVRITNCVRCRPPENRDPQKGELENCRGYLEREISEINPTLVVTLGKVPTEHLLCRDAAVTKESGNIEDVRLGESSQQVLICVHPAATLYDSSQAETFTNTIATAAGIVGADGDTEGQSRLDGF